MFGIESEDKSTALASAITYWVFRCRDKSKTPAMGLKTWEYLQSSVTNAAIPSRNIDAYIENLSKKLIVAHLNPKEWNRIVAPKQIILRGQVDDNGNISNISQIDSDQHNPSLQWIGWEEILRSLVIEGIEDRHILTICKNKPHIICTYCRIRYEQDKALNTPEEIETLDVEVQHD